MILPIATATMAATTATQAANTAAVAALIAARDAGRAACPRCGEPLPAPPEPKPEPPRGRLRKASDAIGEGMDVALIDYFPITMIALLLVFLVVLPLLVWGFG